MTTSERVKMCLSCRQRLPISAFDLREGVNATGRGKGSHYRTCRACRNTPKKNQPRRFAPIALADFWDDGSVPEAEASSRVPVSEWKRRIYARSLTSEATGGVE